jgi:hypothetical protein
MRLIPIFTAAAIVALSAGVASAQSTGAGDMNQGAPTTSDTGQTTTGQTGAPNAQAAGAPAAATVMDTSNLPPIDTAKAGDPNVITNGPIPDTKENRAKYGQPMSNAGRHTAPAGN